MNHCIRHFEEPISGTCKSCGQAFCRRCLVYPFGPKKPPFCVGCALAEAGVRQTARVHTPEQAPPDRKVLRAERKAQRDAAKLERKAAKAAAKAKPVTPAYDPAALPPPPSATVPAPSTLSPSAAEAVSHPRPV